MIEVQIISKQYFEGAKCIEVAPVWHDNWDCDEDSTMQEAFEGACNAAEVKFSDLTNDERCELNSSKSFEKAFNEDHDLVIISIRELD
jgi:hypothetical protein